MEMVPALGNFIIANLHILSMVGAVAVGGLVALTGFQRQIVETAENDLEDPERVWTYRRSRIKAAGAVGGILVALTSFCVFTPKGYEGVIIDLANGVQEQELSGGQLNFVFPLKQFVTNVNTQVQVYRFNDPKVFQHTKDTQEINVFVAVNYTVTNPSYFIENVAGGVETILKPALLRSLRTKIGSYNVEQVAPNQTAISVALEREIASQSEGKGISVDFVAIEDIIPSRAFIAAIEEERIAARRELTAVHEKNIAITKADEARETAAGVADARIKIAEAERQQMLALGMSPAEFVWYTVWNGSLPTVVGSDGLILELPELPEQSSVAPPVAPTTTVPGDE